MHYRLLVLAALPAIAAPKPALDAQFETTVKPYIAKNCTGCHSGKTPAAQFDLKAYTNIESVTRDYPRWHLVMERLTAKDMPPKPMPAPPAADTQHVIEWIEAVRAQEIKKYAGDPGLVSARRLSNAEYNYTVRDLTGQDMKVTREFPIDPANPAGFDNSGESLTMSPALLNKYLQAAREVANHMVLKPDTLDFSPHPMIVETDREKYSVQRIVNFYYRQPTKYWEYFQAAWRYKNRAALGKPRATLATIAAEAHISPKYLPQVWQLVNEPNAVGPVRKLQTMWNALPSPADKKPELLAAKCTEMHEFVERIRSHTAMQYAAPKVKGLPAGSQPLLNWKLHEFSLNRRNSDPAALRNDTDPAPVVPEIPRYAGLHQEAAPRWAAVTARARATDTDLVVPAAERKRYEAAFARFAQVFPDRFYITERGRYWPDESQDKGRLLNAGYHSVLGFYRDDAPLVELILDDKGKAELDRLWNEFDYIAHFTERTWVQYFFNQSGEVQGKGAESGTARPKDHALTDTEVVLAMRDSYLAKAAADPANDPIAPHAIRHHYDGINATLRDLERQRKAAEPKHLEALVKFAAKAYRRPLTQAERTDLLGQYQTLRTKNELSHEDALRESLVSILMSPDYLYRIDLQTSSRATKPSGPVPSQPLSGYALASRLSYFLWSSAPDEELLKHAAAGDLHKPEVLLAQTRRMLKDPRVRGLATEFTGNWLTFRHFEKNNSVDRERFPSFNDDLREAMFQEPVRMIEDAVAGNRPVFDLLYGKYTFVNPILARHYGMPAPSGSASYPIARPVTDWIDTTGPNDRRVAPPKPGATANANANPAAPGAPTNAAPAVAANAAPNANGNAAAAAAPGAPTNATPAVASPSVAARADALKAEAKAANAAAAVATSQANANQWYRVEDAAQYGRGGLLPMAVFLTQNSPGLRTSPVKRGNWVVQRILGEVVPPPPPVVPELPHDESTSDLPIRAMLAKHRENAMCAACHQRIDSFGLAFEGYGPVGNARTTDLAGRPVDTVATYPGGSTGTGVQGLQAFIREHRQQEFVTNISRKLLAFALNRSLQLSDEALVERMQTRAAANGYRFNTLIEAIVTSPQFTKKRIPEVPQTWARK